MRRSALSAAALLAAVALVALGYRIGRRAAPPAGHPVPAMPGGGATPARRILYWYDPMAPGQHFDHPGLSPMGMQMVPKYADGNTTGDRTRNTFTLAPYSRCALPTASAPL